MISSCSPQIKLLLWTKSEETPSYCTQIQRLCSGPVKCCTTFSLNPLPLNRLKHFAIQDATTVCRLNAVIFTTVKNRKICANPDAQWVKNAVSHLKNKEKPTEASSEAV
uniref:C-C motif chemokine n=1 Tax=Pygocentrus nattereri TaxID=42514 RepID=A0AAR2L6D6_PYGNA